MITFAINGRETLSDQPSDTPLLWVIRDELGLTGTKFGCGMAQCGACTVHVNGVPTRSCVTPVSAGPGERSTPPQGVAPPRGHPPPKGGGARPGAPGGRRHARADTTPGAGAAPGRKA